MTRMLRHLATQVLDIGAEIVRRGLDALVPERLGDRGDRHAPLQQRGREARAQQVRVETAPWSKRRALQLARLERPARDAERGAAVARGEVPHAPRVAEAAAVPCHEQRAALAGSRLAAATDPAAQRRLEVGQQRHVAIARALAGAHEQPALEHVAELERYELAGADPGL